MEGFVVNLSFYKDKKVLITGHTGFKGTWMCKVLTNIGANVIGYALEPPKGNNIYDITGIENQITSVIGDIRDLKKLRQVFEDEKPEIVIHMAAQPIVRESYLNPVYTYDVNVMGTVNVLECVRLSDSVKSFLNVTTDKVYKNQEWEWGYRENEELNGYDPYSNSKSCSELVTSSYINSFFSDRDISISTARAGNVIGGGDFAKDRIIPDCARSAVENEKIFVRNPNSVRPYQHVLEPVIAYLIIAMEQYLDKSKAGNYNVGPNESDCLTTRELVNQFCDVWQKKTGQIVEWYTENIEGPHEATFLKLDCSHIKKVLSWNPVWNANEAVTNTVEWYIKWSMKEDMNICIDHQIEKYIGAF